MLEKQVMDLIDLPKYFTPPKFQCRKASKQWLTNAYGFTFYQMLICTHQCMLSLGLWQQFRSSLIFLSSKLVTEEVSARGSLEQHSILQSHKKCKFLKFAICQVITYFYSFNETIEIGMIPNIGQSSIVSNLVDRFRW